MSFLKKDLISDRTLLIWLFTTVITGIGFSLITAVVIYMMYDCWIMYQHQLAGGKCSADVNIELITAIPITLGVVVGTILTRKIIKDEKKVS